MPLSVRVHTHTHTQTHTQTHTLHMSALHCISPSMHCHPMQMAIERKGVSTDWATIGTDPLVHFVRSFRVRIFVQ